MAEAIKLIYYASYWEINTPKPGNIGPERLEHKPAYNEFLKGLEAIIRTFSDYFVKNEPFKKKSIGIAIKTAVFAMIENQTHGNVLLGHVLLYSPLLCALTNFLDLQQLNERDWVHFWREVENVIELADENDGALLAEAVIHAHPGGLKNPGGMKLETKYDFTDLNSPQRIKQDKKSLKELFQESADFDSISREYTQNYVLSRRIIESWLIPNINKFESKQDLVLALFLYILSIEPDSLILRKNTLEVAQNIQQKAQVLIRDMKNTPDLQPKLLEELDNFLHKAGGKLNPGTSADLTACIIFISTLFGIIN